MLNKTITYRGGVVEFEIPAHWIEEYGEDGGAAFYEDRENSGTLRLNVITLEAPINVGSDRVIEALQVSNADKKGDILKLENGNAVLRYSETVTAENGTEITIFYWMVANPLGERHVRIGDFSYTVLATTRDTEQTKSEINFLEHAIFNSRFYPELGVQAT